MTDKNQTFTVCGITTDARGDSKVRWTQDLIRRTKLFAKQGHGRIDLVDLPRPMTKLEALAHIASLPQFSNPGDQMTIADAQAYREKAKAKAEGTYVPKKRGRPRKNPVAEIVVKQKTVRGKKAPLSLDAIKARATKQDTTAQALDLLKAVAV